MQPQQVSPSKRLLDPDQGERELIAEISKRAKDPLSHVRFVYPWGKVGSRLENETGPDEWQVEVLTWIGEEVRKGLDPKVAMATAIKAATASGHGIGKTALVAWIIHWFASSFEFCQGVVTANTKTQLLTKTWRELAKWRHLAINGHWFEWTATQYKSIAYPDTWFISAIPWSEHASEAFAGTHERFVLIVFDEASLIADKIFEVAEGAMTGLGEGIQALAIWLVFGNPTRNSGAFAECFKRMKHRWKTWQIDSRRAKKANKAQIQQWVDDYGEDSDFVRVRVRGVFPRAGSMQLISSEDVALSMARVPTGFEDAARVMGVDVARHGDDESCITKRQGVKMWPQERMRIPDTMLLSDRILERINEFSPDGVFIDVVGMGWGVYDNLRRKLGERARILYAVDVGKDAIEPNKHYNRRAEVWWRMREWIKEGGCLPANKDGKFDTELEADLTGVEYGYDNRERVQLEKKEDMKERGLASPDGGDSLAMTFATTVEARRVKKPTWRDRLRSGTTEHPGETHQSA